MVGQNAPGCLPDTTEPLPIYDNAADALEEFSNMVRAIIQDDVSGVISEKEANEVMRSLNKTTVEELQAPGFHDLTLTVAGRVHFIHAISFDPIRETKVESLVDLINFIRKNYHIIPERRIHRYQFPDGERNGLIFAVLLVAGIKYDDGVQQRPTQEWSDGHDAAYELVMDLTLDPEAAANRLLGMGDAV
jgi:hypothetical protein